MKFQKGRIINKTKFKLMNQLNLIRFQPHSTLYSIQQSQLLRKKKVAVVEKNKEFAPPPYKPIMPFPGRFKKELIEKYKALFD